MPTFNPGDKVLLSPCFGSAIGTMQERSHDGNSSVVATLSGRRFFTVRNDEMRLIPAGALELDWGSRFRVCDNAPRYASYTGCALRAEFINGVFGYWVLLDSNDRTWIPANVLMAEAGEP